MKKNNLFIGLMSGTSMDGVDAAVIDLPSNSFIKGITRPYSAAARVYLEKVLQGDLCTLKSYSQLNTLLGKEFAQATLDLIEEANLPATAIRAIGSHGQTLCHDASADIPYTVQLGCAHTIAELTGITVVADFRTRDLILGGQGAPFAPIYHQALFKGQEYPLAIINIGGIANITYLANEAAVQGYDLGPGNCLMDNWIQSHHQQAYDKNGAWAKEGQVIPGLLEALLADPYFQRQQPKSIGKEYFSLLWLRSFLKSHYSAIDVQATLLQLTAIVIAQGIKAEAAIPKQVFICGGGAHNLYLLQRLAELLPAINVDVTSKINISPDYVEALMIAWLAEKTLNHIPLDLSSITGAKCFAVLGVIYPAGITKSG